MPSPASDNALYPSFREATGCYGAPEPAIRQAWDEIQKCYSHPKRHYHNLDHLSHLLAELGAVSGQIRDYPPLLLALFYHDIVYNILKHDNEARSADRAEERLRQLGVPDAPVRKCRAHILATKSHQPADDPDTDLFTDADLSILGADPDTYRQYTARIRKEYAFYPDLMYYPGRRKVLTHFLDMPRIYKTTHFAALYEEKARQNLQAELALIS